MSLERKAPLKRTGELKRTRMPRGQSSLKRDRMNPRSARNVAEGEIRKEIRTPTLKGRCRIGPILEELGVAGGCAGRGRVEGLHERRKASSGGSKVNEANLVPACNRCNGIIEDAVGDEREAIDNDDRLVVRERHPDWASLGRRNDRAL